MPQSLKLELFTFLARLRLKIFKKVVSSLKKEVFKKVNVNFQKISKKSLEKTIENSVIYVFALIYDEKKQKKTRENLLDLQLCDLT
jgi:hypothetical protein